ncbi:MAG: type II secretion system protein GspN [Pseudomonadota bacterium]|nr:type II secretion system protein GspN [Pseudomonadota bacterium]
MIQRLLLGLAALLWGGVTFLLGLYVTFPAAAARDRVVYEFGQWSRNEYALGIGDLSLWRLSGVALDDVTFYTVKKVRKPKDEEAPPSQRIPLLHLDGLAVRAAPFAMLMGKDAVAFVAEIYGGALDGQLAQSETGVEISFDGGDIDLARLPVATEQMKLNLLGVADGEADLTFDTSDVKNSAGFLKLSFEGLGLGPDSAVAGFGLPEVLFTKAAVAFEIKDGKMAVTEGDFESDTLNATLSGDIVLNKKLVRSRNRLEFIFSLPEDLDKLAQISPDLKRSRDEEGKYHLNIGGTVLSPSVRFSRASASNSRVKDSDGSPRLPGGGMRDGPLALDGAPGGDFAPSADPEERRRAREERIKERRQRLKDRREQAERDNPILQEDRDAGGKEGGPDNLDEFEPGDEGPGLDRAPFPPDGGMDDVPMEGGPMDDGPPPDFEE